MKKIIFGLLVIILLTGCGTKKEDFTDVEIKDDGSYYLETAKEVEFDVVKENNEYEYNIVNSSGVEVKTTEKDNGNYVVITPETKENETYIFTIIKGSFKNENLQNTKTLTYSLTKKSVKEEAKNEKTPQEVVNSAIDNTLNSDNFTMNYVDKINNSDNGIAVSEVTDFISSIKFDRKNQTYYEESSYSNYYGSIELKKTYQLNDENVWLWDYAYNNKFIEERAILEYLKATDNITKQEDGSYYVVVPVANISDISKIDFSWHVSIKYQPVGDLAVTLKIDNDLVTYMMWDATNLIKFEDGSNAYNIYIRQITFSKYNESEVIIPEEAKNAPYICDYYPDQPCY